MCRLTFLMLVLLLIVTITSIGSESSVSSFHTDRRSTPSYANPICPDNPSPIEGEFCPIHGTGRDNPDNGPKIVVFPTYIRVDSTCEYAINIANEGVERLDWLTETEADWISCDPEQGELQPNEDCELFIMIDGRNLRRGVHDAHLYIRSNDMDNGAVIVTITFLKDYSQPPRWVEVPRIIEAYATEFVEFQVRATDPENDQLNLTCSSEDLPDRVRFIDNGNGTGTFHWQTVYSDTGIFHVGFQVTDGVNWISTDMVINIERSLGGFALSHPENGSWQSADLPIDFNWHSASVLPNQNVTYTLKMRVSNRSIIHQDIGDTCVSIDPRDLRANRGIASAISWEVWAHYEGDSLCCNGQFYFTLAPTSVNEDNSTVLRESAISYAYPNPFNEATTIWIRHSPNGGQNLDFYDIHGRLIERVSLQVAKSGWWSYNWNPTGLGDGTYFAVFRQGSETGIVKLLLIR